MSTIGKGLSMLLFNPSIKYLTAKSNSKILEEIIPNFYLLKDLLISAILFSLASPKSSSS